MIDWIFREKKTRGIIQSVGDFGPSGTIRIEAYQEGRVDSRAIESFLRILYSLSISYPC